MAPEEWFRTSDWDAAAQAEFERKLARAREHNRPQYLRIKAAALREAGRPDAAKTLLQRLLDEYPRAFDVAYSAETLGDLALAAGDPVEAETYYRHSLQARPDMNATTGEVHIGLAEALLGQRRHDEALKALEYIPPTELKLAHAHCRWNAALAEAALGLGEQQVAGDAARRALDLLNAPDHFARHPGVGRARLTPEQIKRLRQIASGQAARSPLRRWLRRP